MLEFSGEHLLSLVQKLLDVRPVMTVVIGVPQEN